MTYKMAEQIADAAERFSGRANIAAINREFRAMDESHLWPVSNRFNATERAIRRIRRSGMSVYGLEYALALEWTISEIVNGVV